MSQYGNKLTGTGGMGTTQYLGSSVALSYNGFTLASGGYNDNSGVGAVWIFTRSNSTALWSQQANKLVGSGGIGTSQYQGVSVALSADGTILASGGSLDKTHVGAVWIFTRTGTTWSQQGNKLVGLGAIGSAYQGTSVALSADGKTLASGAPYDSGGIGAVWIFTFNGTMWLQEGNKLVGIGGIGSSQYQGYSVALSGDGTILASGGYLGNSGSGGVWIFTKSGTTWSANNNNEQLVGSGAVGTTSNQGYSVAISGDGLTLASGASGDNGGAGAVWIFTFNGTTWVQFGGKLVGSGAVGSTAHQGSSVSLSGDGTTVVTGGFGDNLEIGAVWVFAKPTMSPTVHVVTSSPTKFPVHSPSAASEILNNLTQPLISSCSIVGISVVVVGVIYGGIVLMVV
jgi:hypothetical protein